MLTQLSCKKEVEPDNPPPPSDYSHMEGNFLCQSEELYAYDPGNEVHFDKVIEVSVSNDTLFVINQSFVIGSETQMVFTKTVSDIFSILTVTVTFENNYNDISIDYHINGSPGSGPDYDRTYIGSRTSLPQPGPGTPHIDEQIMEGLYALTVTHLDTYMNIDTTYTDTIDVSYNSGNFYFDLQQIQALKFSHTYMNYDSWDYANAETKETDVFWDRVDSLYVFDQTIHDLISQPEDTVMFEYFGRHL
ncbi:MAG: hypothetical protein AB8B56_04275 [Crocinitomicaceae bacterium]